MQRKWTTHSELAGSVVHDREADLGQHQEDRDPVSVCLAILGLCAPASLSQLFGLGATFHRGASLLSYVVVVVAGAIHALVLGRSPSSGHCQLLLHRLTGKSGQALARRCLRTCARKIAQAVAWNTTHTRATDMLARGSARTRASRNTRVSDHKKKITV